MATAHPSPSLQSSLDQRRFVGWGLFWGAIVLAIMGCWLNVKYLDIPDAVVWALWLLAAGALVLAILQWRRPATLDDAALTGQRRLVATILLIVGLVLVPAALWLLLRYGLQGFGESIGLLTLGCIALGAGVKLNSTTPAVPFQERLLRGVIDGRAGISTVLGVLGAALAIFAFWLARFSHAGTIEDPAPDFPLWLAPGLFGLLFLGVSAYLRFTPDLNVATARFVVLVA
ncbi:MAG TPA: hypothetical protein VKE24_08995, partial [Candidatus Acidoferrales bacterium]|nr:hypothetical protein [Candidatus Acidoferrales bacterium]